MVNLDFHASLEIETPLEYDETFWVKRYHTRKGKFSPSAFAGNRPSGMKCLLECQSAMVRALVGGSEDYRSSSAL